MVCFDVSSYNSKTFDNLPSLHEAKTAFDKAGGVGRLEGLGKILRKFNQQHKFGLILLHKHFKMSSKELTVEVLSESETVSMPWSLSEEPTPVFPSFLDEKGFNSSPVGVIQPHSWIFNANGTLSPYDFYCTNELNEKISRDFLKALHQELKCLNLDSVLGLHLLHRGRSNVAIESTVNAVRANVLQLKQHFDESEVKGAVNVIWTFGKESGEAVQDCICSGGADDPMGHVHI